MKTKLRLNRETLRRLTFVDLAGAQGGSLITIVYSCDGDCQESGGPTCAGCGTRTCQTCLQTGCVPRQTGPTA